MSMLIPSFGSPTTKRNTPKMRIPQEEILTPGTYDEWKPRMDLKITYDVLITRGALSKLIRPRISAAVLNSIPGRDRKRIEALMKALPRYSAPFRFMDLPPEIRVMVYSCVNFETRVQIGGLSYGRMVPTQYARYSGVALADVSSIIRQEVLPMVYSQMVIRLNMRDWKRLQTFLAHRPAPDLIGMISHIHLFYYSGIFPSMTVDLKTNETISFDIENPHDDPEFEEDFVELKTQARASFGQDYVLGHGEDLVKRATELCTLWEANWETPIYY